MRFVNQANKQMAVYSSTFTERKANCCRGMEDQNVYFLIVNLKKWLEFDIIQNKPPSKSQY